MSPMLYIVPRGLALFVALATLLPGTAPAQTQARAQTPSSSVLDDPFVRFQAKRGLDHLYDMHFDQARVLFDQIDERYPKHPIGPFLGALNTWWKILIDIQDTSHDAEFFEAMDEVIKRSDRILKRDPNNLDAMFFKGAALGFRGRHRSNRGDWFKAAMDGKRAMDYVLGLAERNPENNDFIFGKGIYDYYAAVVPKRYPFARPFMVFFPDGNRERGLQELQRTAEEGYFIQTEAAYFLLQIYYLFEKDFDQSIKYVTWLREQHPRNPFFHTLEGRIYARWGHWTRAQQIFEEVLQCYKERQSAYNDAAAEQALYYIGRSLLLKNDYEQALNYLLKLEALAARTDRETYFKVLGKLRQGMAYDALGRRELAVARYRQVLRMKDHAGAHERAQRYLEHAYKG